MIQGLIAVTMSIERKVRRLEEHPDGLFYLANAEDQVELSSQGKLYYDWYKQSDQVKFPAPKSTMCYS